MADLPPVDPLLPDPPPISATAASSSAPPPPPPPPPAETLTSAAVLPSAAVTSASNLGGAPGLAPKRQRRPSVRLGEIGDQTFDQSQPRRPKTSWRYHKDPSVAAKTSKTRPLTNLVNGVNGGGDSYPHGYRYDFAGGRKPKSKRPTKRARSNSNWASSSAVKYESSPANGAGAAGGMIENDAVFRDENLDANNDNSNNEDEFRELVEAEEEEGEAGSQSPIDEQLRISQSPVHSMDNQPNMGLQFWDRRVVRGHRRSNSETLEQHIRQSTATNRKNTNFSNNRTNGVHNEMAMNSGDEENNRSSSVGVRDWLIGLGLGRYAPVFEMHEVDDEVLHLLTLEDLKDMGINAVGSRRKMYSAILKLRRDFS